MIKLTKNKYLIIISFIFIILFLIPSFSTATEVEVTRDIYSNTGSMKFDFKGLNLDTTHEYEFGFTKTTAAQVEDWFLLTEYTSSTASIDIVSSNTKFRDVINSVDTGYITIKDKTSDTIILQGYGVDLKIPYLSVTNYTVIPNGKNLENGSEIQVGLRTAGNSEAYYQYEKITDENIISKYKEIKAKNGNVSELQSILKTSIPSLNWIPWQYWNGYSDIDGFGRTQRNINVPDSGLYYMWLYFSGINVKNVYGYILVDNLEEDIALESISLPKTETVELNKTLSLTLTFNPTSATNKIVTWSSSDETVATVDNSGKITAKKIGSTIITAISQEGDKKASCTVTVTENTNSSTENDNNSNKSENENDKTVATVNLPNTGLYIGLVFIIIALISGSIFAYIKYGKIKNI